MPFGRSSSTSTRRQLGQPAVHPLRERLDHQHVGVAIDDERGQPIGLAVHQAVGRGVDVQATRGTQSPPRGARASRLADGLRRRPPSCEARSATGRCTALRPARRSRGPITVTRSPGAALAPRDVAAIDPRMAAPHAIFAAMRDVNESTVIAGAYVSAMCSSLVHCRTPRCTASDPIVQSRRHVHDRLALLPRSSGRRPRDRDGHRQRTDAASSRASS